MNVSSKNTGFSSGRGRLLGLDVGERRIGVAFSDDLGLTAQPHQTVQRTGGRKDLQAIGRLAEQMGVCTVVVGLPLNMDGSTGRQARAVKMFAAELERALNLPIVFWDERLTSVQAERVLLQADLSRAKRKKHVDKLAAVLILQGYLDADRAASGAIPSPPDPDSAK